MATFSHAIYIDESGNGAPVPGIQSCWVSVAVAISFSDNEILEIGSKSILRQYFRLGERELKGKHMPNHLLKDTSIDQVICEIGDLLTKVKAVVWIAGVRQHPNHPLRNISPRLLAKDVARKSILGEINDYLDTGAHSPNHFLIIWDISDEQELEDFSRNVATFRHARAQGLPNPRLAHAILGGLSHDWDGLQIADIIAHCAIHWIGFHSSLPDANPIKAKSFERYLEPRCRITRTGRPWY
jgi:hypothetical protein